MKKASTARTSQQFSPFVFCCIYTDITCLFYNKNVLSSKDNKYAIFILLPALTPRSNLLSSLDENIRSHLHQFRHTHTERKHIYTHVPDIIHPYVLLSLFHQVVEEEKSEGRKEDVEVCNGCSVTKL